MTKQDTLNDFLEKGWATFDTSLTEGDIDGILASCSGLYEEGSDHPNENNRIQDAWRFSASVKDLAINPGIMDVVEGALGGAAFPFQTLNFNRGTEQPLHSDFFHFSSRQPDGMCGVWVALEKTGQDNGSLEVVTGSHRLPYCFPEDLGIPIGLKSDPYKFYGAYESKIAEVIEGSGLKRERVFVEKGQAIIWHSNLIHGGSPIKIQTASRFSQVTHYFKAGSAYFSPIISYKRPFGKNYRIPFDVSTGRRALRHLSFGSYLMDLIGF
jgi:hypothetical protein